MTTESDTTDPRSYSDTWSTDDKLDFIAYHLRVQSAMIDEIREAQTDILARVNATGQSTVNVEAFCKEVRSAIEGMRTNPLMRGMLPKLPPPPGPGKLIT
jgi:hypothetical protein